MRACYCIVTAKMFDKVKKKNYFGVLMLVWLRLLTGEIYIMIVVFFVNGFWRILRGEGRYGDNYLIPFRIKEHLYGTSHPSLTRCFMREHIFGGYFVVSFVVSSQVNQILRSL